jgi:hydroxymethylpyrimidine pyrophosphatase-like HAD family hydrolase
MMGAHESEGSMHLTILVCDLDGTLAEDGVVAAQTWDALRAARAHGLTLVLATGRTLHSFTPDGPFAELFQAIVAEDGAVVYFPRQDAVHLPFGQIPADLRERIVALQLPLEYGMAIVATRVPHDRPILDLLRSSGGGATIEYNRGAVMVLPPGATKGTGLAFALTEMGLSPRNVVACGDAENDRSLLAPAELAVAVGNATAELKQAADLTLREPDGAGIAGLIRDLIGGTLAPRRLRPERQINLGQRIDRAPCMVDPWLMIDQNMAIIGDSTSGKSWLGGLLAESISAQGYQVVVIDPEGDYHSLTALPHTMLVGGAGTDLRRVGDIVTLAEYARVNLVVDLSGMPLGSRAEYTGRLMHALLDLRMRTGRPHWLLIDEAQQICAPGEEQVAAIVGEHMRLGGVALVSYRASQIAPAILGAVRVWALTHTSSAEELAALDEIFADRPCWPRVRAAVEQLPRGQAHLLLPDQGGAHAPAETELVFRTRSRRVPHIRHLHKYVRVPLTRDKWFVFRTPDGAYQMAAANLSEFAQAIERAPSASLAYHLERGDFARWLAEVLHDVELSRQVRKLARRRLAADDVRRELRIVVSRRYEELLTLL